MTKLTDRELLDQYGSILSFSQNEDSNRVHIDKKLRLLGSGLSVKVQGAATNINLYIVICLDTQSPIGQFTGQYVVPFTPDSDFHLDNAHLWIYPKGKREIRLEVRVPMLRRFAGQDIQMLEMIYGVQVKTKDCHNLEFRE
jgi:hypothetical protein